MREVSLDTEYADLKPFLASSCDERGPRLYWMFDRWDFMRVKRLVESEAVTKVYHNAPSDMFVLSNIGIEHRGPFEDTMLASSLVDEQFDSVNLKALARVHLGADTKSETFLRNHIKKVKRQCEKEGRKFSFALLNREVIEPYAEDDAILTRRLWMEKFRAAVRPYQETYEFEKSVVPVVVWMMRNGFRVDRRFAVDRLKYHRLEMERLARRMVQYLKRCGVRVPNFNPQSPEQLGMVLRTLHDRLPTSDGIHDCDGVAWARTQKGFFSTESDELLPRRRNLLCKQMLEFRFHKTQVKYYSALVTEFTSPADPVAHFMYYQTGASTGRFTAELIQTIPRPEESKKAGEGFRHQVRRAFVPGRGRKFLVLDAAQEELRVFAHFSRCRGMLDFFRRGIDPYVGTAEDIFSKDLVHRTPDLFRVTRKIGKDCSLSAIYYVGKEKLLFSIVHRVGEMMSPATAKALKLDEAKAAEVYTRFHLLYPEVKTWNKRLISEAHRTGCVELRLDSKLMHIYRVYRLPKELAYRAGNAVVQGACSFILKAMMLRARDFLERERLLKDVLLHGCVHDELIFSYPNMSAQSEEDLIAALVETVEDHVTFLVPIIVEAKISSRSWADVQKVEVRRKVERAVAAL